jgi:integrase
MASMSNQSNWLSELNHRQRAIFESRFEDFKQYLESEGKDPRKEIGYAEGSINARSSRVRQLITWIWEQEGIAVEITPEQADRVIEALDTDDLRCVDNTRYSEGSKRKLSNGLVNWFEFRDIDWEPEISFNDEPSTDNADPFTKDEVKRIWEASLTYKSIPRYNNLSPEGRDRWRAYLAQELGKPKNTVKPADWDTVNKCWKIPSIIATERSAGWRPALIERMKVHWYNPDKGTISIPAEMAVKSTQDWEQKLGDDAIEALDFWLKQRDTDERYDDSDYMWLNRQSNPYRSATLNDVLDDLLEEANIKLGGRKISWYSFRHTLGTYTHEEHKDLKTVAETLRQTSTESADRYVHPTDEILEDAANIL